tara:strand:+ start:3354 stop:3572 length:219 start_codon:yes stop_codon:yes gene_type:complete
MARPRKSTKDEWLDQFADWDTETQENLIDTCELLHRQAKRREGRKGGETMQMEMIQVDGAAPLLMTVHTVKS